LQIPLQCRFYRVEIKGFADVAVHAGIVAAIYVLAEDID
jgi:hypothetical protein